MKTGCLVDFPRILGIFILLGMIVTAFPTSATIFTTDGLELDDTGLHTLLQKPVLSHETPVQFFYDPECGACEPVHDYFDAYLAKNPDTIIESISLSDGSDNMDRFKNLSTVFNRNKMYIPLVIIGPIALEGTDDIMTYFEEVYFPVRRF